VANDLVGPGSNGVGELTLRGRPPAEQRTERRNIPIYGLPQTQQLLRRLAEAQETTIGRLVDQLVAEEAARCGIDLGSA
jgi:hypothetical protein